MRPEHQRFVELYLESFNATDAYQQAGYQARGHSAEVAASRLIRRPDITEAICAGLAKRPKVQERARKTGQPVAFHVPGTRLTWMVDVPGAGITGGEHETR